MNVLDSVTLPCADAAQAELDHAMRHYDPDAAQRAIVAVHRAQGPESAFEALARWAARTVIPNGHHAIALAQYSRILRAHDWVSAEPSLRQIAYSLSLATDSNAFLQLRDRIDSMPSNWADGADDDSAAIELLQGLRAGDVESAGVLAADRLAQGLSPQSIWDATFLHAAEAVVFGGCEHAVTSTNALHDIYVASRDPATRLLALLSAPGWAVSMTNGSGSIDTLAPAPAPASAEEVALATSFEERMALALGWLEEGGDENQLIDATHRYVVQNHSEFHGYKVPVAQHETAMHASPSFARRLRAAHAVAYSRGVGKWERYDEAFALVADLP